MQFEGLTGPIQFAESKRSNFKLDLMKLKSHSIDKVGEWTPKDGLNVTDRYAFQHGRNFKLLFIVACCYTQIPSLNRARNVIRKVISRKVAGQFIFFLSGDASICDKL